MSDLQCAARVLVARHGEADYETELLADDGAWLTALGRKQSTGLAKSLTGERIAHVYVSSKSRAVQTGEIVAALLGVGVTVREALQEFSVAHRGETVLVISHGGVMCMALPVLARNLTPTPQDRPVGNCSVVRLDVDDDGWVARSRAGEDLNIGVTRRTV